MKRSAKCKCVHCSELFLSDFRNRGRQLHCAKPECRKVARRSSQQRWLAKAENQNYFRGPENCARVREWRARHPGYWRKKKPAPRDALQEGCSAQHAPLLPNTLLLIQLPRQEHAGVSNCKILLMHPAHRLYLLADLRQHPCRQGTVRSFCPFPSCTVSSPESRLKQWMRSSRHSERRNPHP